MPRRPAEAAEVAADGPPSLPATPAGPRSAVSPHAAQPSAPAAWRAIDPSPPWLAPYRAGLARVLAALDAGSSFPEALDALVAGARPVLAIGALRFVPHAALPAGEAYEAFIARTGTVPTRENLHDLFNGLVWWRFPRLKRRMNELQAEAIARDGIGSHRGALRDALTLLDENGAWLQAPDALAQPLLERRWREAFVERRAAWVGASLVVVGHALLEKLTAPRPAMTAHLHLLPGGRDAEGALVARLSPEWAAARRHSPLPVLGVPGWWPANEDPSFYDDATVFRPASPPMGPRRDGDNRGREAGQTAAGATPRGDAKAPGRKAALEEGPDCTGRRSS